MKDKVLAFLKTQQLCVLSTVSKDGLPESAVMGFSENDQLELTLGTEKSSRKYKNLLFSPSVSIVIGGLEGITVQYDGTARVLDEAEARVSLKNHLRKLPIAEKFASRPGQVWIKVTPKWLRYTDTKKEPQEIEELRQFR